MPVITGAMEYPDALAEKLKAAGFNLLAVDALSLAEEAGNYKAVNVVMIGVLSCFLDFPMECWEKAIEVCVPPKFLDVNKKAFTIGRVIGGTKLS